MMKVIEGHINPLRRPGSDVHLYCLTMEVELAKIKRMAEGNVQHLGWSCFSHLFFF